MNTELVVIVDNEARDQLEHLGWRYFRKAREQDDNRYFIKTPIGETKEVTGTLVKNHELNYHTSEYFYLELTNNCNFSCAHCGVRGDIEHLPIDQIESPNARYISDEFVEKLAEALSGPYPVSLGQRNFFYGGGETLLNSEKFAGIHNNFNDLEKTSRVVITNGCSLPLDFDAFQSYMEMMGRPYLFLTYSKEHSRQFTLLREAGSLDDYIPGNVPSQDTLREKVKIIGSYCAQLGIGFTALVLDNQKDNSSRNDLRSYILENATETTRQIHLIGIEKDGHREPCSEGRELAIRTNGDTYPHCYDIFTDTNRIGITGLLLK